MIQLTIRIDDPALEAGLKVFSQQHRWSLNQSVNHLLRVGLGLNVEKPPQAIGTSLDGFFWEVVCRRG